MDVDPRLWRTLVVLAEERHFGRAARRLGVSQPAVSQQLDRLEAGLGVALLHRGRGAVRLTSAGLSALPAARTAVTAARAAADAARGGPEGADLTLGISPGTHYVAQRLLEELLARRPATRVRAHQDNTGALSRLVASGQLELALGFCPEPAPGVRVEHLWDERAVLAVARGHALADRGTVALRDVARERFALVDAHDGAGYNGAVVAHCRRAGFEPRVPRAPAGPMAWESAVRSGTHVGLTTRLSAVSTARGIRLLAVDPPVSFPLALLHGGSPGAAATLLASLATRGSAPDAPEPAG